MHRRCMAGSYDQIITPSRDITNINGSNNQAKRTNNSIFCAVHHCLYTFSQRHVSIGHTIGLPNDEDTI